MKLISENEMIESVCESSLKKTCRFLLKRPEGCYCLKSSPARSFIDAEAEKYIDAMKLSGKTDHNYPVGDNCSGVEVLDFYIGVS